MLLQRKGAGQRKALARVASVGFVPGISFLKAPPASLPLSSTQLLMTDLGWGRREGKGGISVVFDGGFACNISFGLDV